MFPFSGIKFKIAFHLLGATWLRRGLQNHMVHAEYVDILVKNSAKI